MLSSAWDPADLWNSLVLRSHCAPPWMHLFLVTTCHHIHTCHPLHHLCLSSLMCVSLPLPQLARMLLSSTIYTELLYLSLLSGRPPHFFCRQRSKKDLCMSCSWFLNDVKKQLDYLNFCVSGAAFGYIFVNKNLHVHWTAAVHAPSFVWSILTPKSQLIEYEIISSNMQKLGALVCQQDYLYCCLHLTCLCNDMYVSSPQYGIILYHCWIHQ